MAEGNIHYAAGQFGYTDLRTQLWAQEATFQSTGVIVARNVVAIDTTGKVATAATNGTASLAIGISQDAATTSGDVSVIVFGVAENVSCNGAVAAGDLLKRSATTAGYVATTGTPTAGEVIGVAINASTANTVDMWVGRQSLS
jgi:hypothetical protein